MLSKVLLSTKNEKNYNGKIFMGFFFPLSPQDPGSPPTVPIPTSSGQQQQQQQQRTLGVKIPSSSASGNSGGGDTASYDVSQLEETEVRVSVRNSLVVSMHFPLL